MAFLVVAGRLAQDSELKKIQSGTSVLKFSVPDTVGWGEKKTTQWIACAIWGKRGEALYEHLKRGSIVEVCGSPVINTYQTKPAWITRLLNRSQTMKSPSNDLRAANVGGGKQPAYHFTRNE